MRQKTNHPPWTPMVWCRYARLRITMDENSISRRMVFRADRIPLDENLVMYHKVQKVAVHIYGAIIGTDNLQPLLGEEAANNFLIVLKNKGKTMRLTSEVKGITKIRDRLLEFEATKILPELRKKLQRGEEFKLGPLVFREQSVLCGSSRSSIPLAESPVVKNGKIRLRVGQQKRQLRLDSVANPFCTFNLLCRPDHQPSQLG